MGIESMKILIGIFSYNERDNLNNTYNDLKRQCRGLNCRIVLIDESEEHESVAIVNKIIKEDNIINICESGHRYGKVTGYNLLYKHFLENNYDILLHFDADHILSSDAVFNLARAIYSGYDIATCLNKPLKTDNFFQRILMVMDWPATRQREIGNFSLPLVGHNGAYNRKAVITIGNIPNGGINEEMYILYKVMNNNLSHKIVSNAISYNALPGTLSDYIKSTRRIYGKVKAFEEYIEKNGLRAETGEKMLVRDMIYAKPPPKLILKSLCSDLTASLLVPYIYLIRWGIMRSAKIYDSDFWESLETTKNLKGHDNGKWN